MQQLPPMNALRAFEAAALEESFIKAGNLLNVSPSAISHQIKNLEDHIDKQLFIRLPRSVRLTQEGKKLYQVVSSSFNDIRKELYGETSLITGELSITVAPSFASGWLIPNIKEFRAEYPNIELKIDSSLAVRDIHDAGIDVAIRHTKEVVDEGMICAKLFSEELQLVCSPDKARRLKTINDISKETLLCSESSPDNWGKVFSDYKIQEPDNIKKMHFSNDTLAIEAAINGAGIAITHQNLSANLIADEKLIEPFSIKCISEYSYYFLHKKSHSSNKCLTAFKDWIIAKVRENS